MIEVTNAQFFKKSFKVMAVVGMNSMPLKVIGRKICLQLKVLLGYQRSLNPNSRNAQTFEERRNQNK
jgi:hypothetical protein